MGQYKLSIWEQNPEYKTKYKEINPNLINVIDAIQSVEAAKKHVHPIPLKDLIKISELSKNLTETSNITSEQFEKLLKEFKCYGSGIKTTIAIIAKLSNGKYPPIDEKNLSGLFKMGIITAEDEGILNGNCRRKIAHIYVEKIVPKWKKDLSKNNNDPKIVDEKWAQWRL